MDEAFLRQALAETERARDVRDYSLRMTEQALARTRDALRGALFHIEEHDHHGECQLIAQARAALTEEGQ